MLKYYDMVGSDTSNTLVKKYINYIHVDSSKRSKQTTNHYYEGLYNLPPYPIQFSNGSTMITIALPNHHFLLNERIVLNNVTSKNLFLRNILMIKKNSSFARIFHSNHGMSMYGLYDPSDPNQFVSIDYVDNLPASYHENDDIPDTHQKYYVLKNNGELAICLSNVKGNDFTRSNIGNIPSNCLNRKHLVYLLFTKSGNKYHPDANSYLIKLDIKSSINYMDGINQIKDELGQPTDKVANNNVYVKFLNLYGVPLHYFNSPHDGFLTIVSITDDTFTVDINYPAIVDPYNSFYHITDNNDQDVDFGKVVSSSNGGGSQIFVRKVQFTKPGYSSPSQYVYPLDRTYKNIISAKIVGSVFPNSQRIINCQPESANNKLYWRNLEDGDHIYQLSIAPGNYSPQQLAIAIENAFQHTIRYPYSESGGKFDQNGKNKYHLVDVDISPYTDVVSFTSYAEQLLQDEPGGHRVLTVPDVYVEFITKDNLENMGLFNPENDTLLVYLTPRSHPLVNSTYPYTYHHLYLYQTAHPSNETYAFLAILETTRAILLNFHRTKIVYPNTDSVQEIKSINTNTVLDNFSYDYLTGEVYLWNHHLHMGDLVITDQFFDPNLPNTIYVYEIIGIRDNDHFNVHRYKHGEKYKFIYDGLLINADAEMVHWLDPELSFIAIIPQSNNKNLLNVYHPNHQLEIGNTIVISHSKSINGVPSTVINGSHTIERIIDADHYQIVLGPYTPQMIIEPTINRISIKYPRFFQLLFNQPDTLGKILGFAHVGEETSVTPYKQTIRNSDPYYGQSSAPLKKLDMTGPNYFYLCCDELPTINNTGPVTNVFAIIRWFDNPGSVVFDSFVPTVKIFHTPLANLSELHLSMYHPDGKLVDFNGLDHSFTIEIVELYAQPSGTDLNERMDYDVLAKRMVSNNK